MTRLPSVGEQFAGYLIQDRVGRGGMSVVYLAEHVSLGRHVALKVLAPELAEDEAFRLRFIRESRLAASLEHPNIIPVYEAGDVGGVLFIAMRFVRGFDLRKLLEERGRLDPTQTVLLMRQAASALDAAHEQGLVHRDVKPANVLIAPGPGSDGSDHVYLTDFGVAKSLGSDSALTKTGEFVGTIRYVAPEQISGRPVDARADVYSLACVAYECLTGRVPFDQEDGLAVMWAHVNATAPAASSVQSDLPSGVDPILARAMAKSPEDRFSSCRQFVADLRTELGVPLDVRTREDDIRTVRRARSGGGGRPSLSRSDAETIGQDRATSLPPIGMGEPDDATPIGPGRRRRGGRRWIVIGATAAALGIVAGLLIVVLPGSKGTGGVNPDCTLLADPTGDDSASGTPQAPLRSLDTLVNRLKPGQTGCLRGTFVTARTRIATDGITLRSATADMAEINGGTIYDSGGWSHSRRPQDIRQWQRDPPGHRGHRCRSTTGRHPAQ